MSKKHKCKHTHHRHQATTPPTVVLTLPAVRMLKEALRLLEDAFAYQTKPLPNLAFGSEVLTGLKHKVDEMLQREEWDRETPFDAIRRQRAAPALRGSAYVSCGSLPGTQRAAAAGLFASVQAIEYCYCRATAERTESFRAIKSPGFRWRTIQEPGCHRAMWFSTL